MLIKTALIIICTYLIYRLAKYAIKRKLEKLLNRTFQKPGIKAEGQLMQCAQCGTWVQEKDGIKKKEKSYCSKKCLKA